MTSSSYVFWKKNGDFTANIVDTSVLNRLISNNSNVRACKDVGEDFYLTDDWQIKIVFDDILTELQYTELQTIMRTYTYSSPKIAPKDNLIAERSPLPSDNDTVGYSPQSKWLYQGNLYICDSITNHVSIWMISNVRYQQCIVPVDFNTTSAAFASGSLSVFVKNKAPYRIEPMDIILPANGGNLVGESMGGVILLMLNGSGITCDGTNGIMVNNGFVSVDHNSKMLTGTNTTFVDSGLVAGQYILLGSSYVRIAAIISNTVLMLVDFFQGCDIVDQPYKAHHLGVGVSITNIIIVNSTNIGISLKGLQNSTLHKVALKSCRINIQLDSCCTVGIVNGASQNATSCGIKLVNTTTVLIDAFSINNSKGKGIDISQGCTGVTIADCNIADNGDIGLYITDSNNVNVSDTKISGNHRDGIQATTTTSLIILSACEILRNGGCGANLLGYENIITTNQVHYNRGHGINADNFAEISGTIIKNNDGDGLNLVFSNDSIASANVIVANKGSGVRLNGNNNILCNNRICDNQGYGWMIEGGDNNISSGNRVNQNIGGYCQDLGTNTEYSIGLVRMNRKPLTSDNTRKLGLQWLYQNGDNPFYNELYTGVGTVTIDNIKQGLWIGGWASPSKSLSLHSTNSIDVEVPIQNYCLANHSHQLDLTSVQSYVQLEPGVISDFDFIDHVYTLTAQDLLGRLMEVQTLQETSTLILPLPTLLQTAWTEETVAQKRMLQVKESFSFTVVNSSNYTLILQTVVGATVKGLSSISSNTSASFGVYFTNVDVVSYVVYRL
jgi:parallel beta-helix repeat protein